MANAFNKEERVAFEQLLEGFQDALVLSNLVSVYNTESSEMERSADIIWRPQPYIAQSFNGTKALSTKPSQPAPSSSARSGSGSRPGDASSPSHPSA